ncbi:M48 family metalloprotease [Micromonospora sp. A3M-1-15]|uniref:M48 family metalloprotease n=1 Tax=Micromonospora sp. A3M-1-15 TaxID=2962035 RepID=UPI0020B887B6|nr:M48 family metalloprotease [Micromonospora sp. A3M-1-15]MCP3783443.1 M48 family metalloprotease [Micromonospora sp. A3M-1-15]
MGEPARHTGTPHPPLPSATLGRFVAAATAVVGTSMFGWQIVLVDAAATRERATCLAGLRGLPPAIDVRAGTVDAESEAAVNRCLGTLDADVRRQLLTGLAVLLVVTALVYLAAPWVERRLRGLRRLDRVPGTEALRADLAALVREAGLRRAPTFLVSRSARVSGNTFGTVAGRYVRLDLGLVHAHRTAPARFRAVVLHELAHLRNADVDLTRLTVALAWAFPLGVVVPAAVTFLSARRAPDLGRDVWRLALFAVVVQVSAWSVLRAREFAADARLGGDDVAGARALLGVEGRPAGWRDRLGALFRFHPLARARADELERPRRLVSARPVEALGAGLAAGIAAPPLMDLLSHLPRRPGGLDALTGGSYAAGLLLGAPLALVLTGTLWRSAWWARRHGGPPVRGAVFGAALVVGLLVGRRLAWSAGYADDRPAWWVELALALGAVAGGALLGRWVVLGADAWLRRLPRHAEGRAVRRVWAAAAVAATVLTAGFLGSLLMLDTWFADGDVSMVRVVAAREGHPDHVTLVTVADTLGWHVRALADHAPYLLAAPLAAALFPLAATRAATWLALRLGVVSGVVAAVALPVVAAGVAVAAHDPGLGPGALRGLVDGHTLLPVTLVEVTAAVAVVAGRRLSVWHGTLAALTAGVLLAPAVLAAGVLLSCDAGGPGAGCAAPDRAAVARALGHALLVAPVVATLAGALGAAVTAVLARAASRRWLASGAAAAVLLGLAAAAVTGDGPGTRSATPVDRDRCLVGVWRLSAGRYHFPVATDSVLGRLAGLPAATAVDLTSGASTGYATAYRVDGTATDLYDLAVAEGTLNGHTVQRVRRGTQTYRWTAGSGRYTQRNVVTTGDLALLRVDGREADVTTVVDDSASTYRCGPAELMIRSDGDDGSWGEETFVRSPA